MDKGTGLVVTTRGYRLGDGGDCFERLGLGTFFPGQGIDRPQRSCQPEQ